MTWRAGLTETLLPSHRIPSLNIVFKDGILWEGSRGVRVTLVSATPEANVAEVSQLADCIICFHKEYGDHLSWIVLLQSIYGGFVRCFFTVRLKGPGSWSCTRITNNIN